MNKPLAASVCFGPAAVLVSFVTLVFCVPPAQAQIYEAVGTRAQAMGGAFVAVADDATATWWNPAGLASGAYFNTILEYAGSQDPRQESRQDSRQPADTSGAVPAWRSATRGFAVAFLALGFSYYHLRVSEIRPFGSIAGSGLSR